MKDHSSYLFFNTIIRFVLCAFLTASASAADNEWEAFQQSERQSFNDYRSEHDKAFTRFLEQHWEEFDLFQKKTRDITPKPPKAPIIKNWRTSVNNELGEDTFKDAFKQHSRDFTNDSRFFGHITDSITFPTINFPLLKQANNKKLAQVWEQLSRISHEETIQALQLTKTDLMLGDWSFYLYLDFLLQQQFPDENQRSTYLWFFLNKMEYNVKIAYDQNNLYLMIPAYQTLYGKSFVEIKGTTYYMMKSKNDNSPLLSYPGKYKRDNHNFNIDFKHIIKPSGKNKSRVLTYKEGDSSTHVALDFDAGISSMLNYYPQTDLIHYFSAQPDETTIRSLRHQLSSKLKGLSEREAINYLLNLTQTGFNYAKDQDQFGEENYLLTEESLLYRANDCEDRSIFLAWLIRDLIKLRVIGLDFPGHVAIAVETKAEQDDWTITSKGVTYVLADPTYIGAEAGIIMPSMKDEQAKVIQFLN